MPEIGRAGRVGFVIAWLILIGAGVGAGQAATRTFIGPNSGNWSVPGHWLEGERPVDVDDVVFPVGAAANSTNDISGLALRSFHADASHRILGNALTVSDGVVSVAPASLRISASVVLNGDQEMSRLTLQLDDVPGLEGTWALAEGRAGGPESYQTYILLANPGTSDAKVALTFLGDRSSAAPATRVVDVPARRRVNVAVDPTGAAGDPATTFGSLITSDQPIVVERAMYWNVNGEVWAAGTNATATRLP